MTGGLVAVFALGLWCVLKWVPMFPSGFFEWAPLGRTVGTAYDIVARATTTGLVGSVFWCAVQRRRPSIGRVVRRTACCLWPLLVFYFLLYAPGHVFWRWLSWTVFTLQVRVLHRAILPTFVWVVPARVLWAWIRVAPVAGLPFPLLALSTKGNARRTLRDLIQLYRRCWRQLTVLLLLTACMFVGLSVAGEAISNPIRSRPSLTYAVSWYIVAVKVLASIAGVMGMFLVIEEWRKSERPTVAGERR